MEEKEWSKGVGEDGRCVRYGRKGMHNGGMEGGGDDTE
jgi:hypothetical protein